MEITTISAESAALEAGNTRTSHQIVTELPLREGNLGKDVLMTPIMVPDENGGLRSAREVQCWRYDCNFIGLLLAIPLLSIFVVATILFIPPLSVIQAFRWCLPTPLDMVERTFSFYALTFFFVLLGIPFFGLAIVALFLTWCVSLIISLPVGLAHWSRTKHSFRSLWPFQRTAGFYTANEADARLPAENLAKMYGYLWPVSDMADWTDRDSVSS